MAVCLKVALDIIGTIVVRGELGCSSRCYSVHFVVPWAALVECRQKVQPLAEYVRPWLTGRKMRTPFLDDSRKMTGDDTGTGSHTVDVSCNNVDYALGHAVVR